MHPHTQKPLLGILLASFEAQRLIDRADLLSDLSIDAAIVGRDFEANAISKEASRIRRQATRLMHSYKTITA